MCGRASQHRPENEYLTGLGLEPTPTPTPYQRTYNLSPGTTPLVIQAHSQKPQTGVARWGYQAGASRLYVNGKRENANSAYWQPLWQRGRIILPVDGWYEWRMAHGQRQPHFVFVKGFPPLYLAGLLGSDGFVVLTVPATATLSPLHERRPLALSPEGALAWLNSNHTAPQAQSIADQYLLPEDPFAWYPVTPAMSNSRYQGKDAARPFKPSAGSLL